MNRGIIATFPLAVALMAASVCVCQAQAADRQATLKQYIADLQRNPNDYNLRERIIKFALTLDPKPDIPKEAERFMARGQAAAEIAKEPADFQVAVAEFEKLVLAAPWLGEAYYNLAAVQEKTGDYRSAIRNLRLYLLATPGASDAKAVEALIYKLEFKQEKSKPATNSLGMKFLPVAGTTVLFCIWETRVQDYQAFVSATGRAWGKPSLEQSPTHPAVNVSWEDAKAFCDWLTQKERQEGQIKAQQSYRLPTDAEWSVAVGLAGETGSTPGEKHMKIRDVYPWGNQWPPPRGAGNYDQDLKVDSFEKTAPVGSFTANQFGLYDLGGNVWEWCEDRHDTDQKYRVLRGGSWSDGRPSFVVLSSSRWLKPGGRDDFFDDRCGFRVVLVAGGSSR